MNHNVCVVSFGELNVDIEALYIWEKNNDVDCNCLTSKNMHLAKGVARRL